MYGLKNFDIIKCYVAGPCEFLVMYGWLGAKKFHFTVAGPCEFLVMYGGIVV